MLGVSSYKKDYVAACRARMDALLASYNGSGAFEQPFLSHMILALDHSFMHRLRGAEGKDGNPLNEVRMLANSLLENGGVMTEDKTIKYKPESSVLKIAIGDTIRLDLAGFGRLATAFFDEIEKRYP